MSSIEVAHSDALYMDYNPFTIAFWMKAPATQTECYFVHKGTFAKNATTGATGKWFGLQYKSSTMYFAVDDDVTKSTLSTASTNFLTDTWVHVVAVRDTAAKMLYLYRNGALVKSQADATKTSIGNEHVFHIGNCSDYTTPLTGYVPFKGSMDDVRMYNYALSSSDISNLYNTSIPVPGVSVNPAPANGSQYANINMPKLTWLAGSAANTFDVYFGTDPESLQLVSSNQSATSFKIQQLLPYNTTYFWRIDSRNIKGTTTGTLWNFTTKKEYSQGVVGKWRLEETTGTFIADSSGYANHGTLSNVSGIVNPVFTTGNWGNCIQFSDNSYVAVPFNAPLYFDTNPFSISLWMKWLSPPSTSAYIIHKGGFAKDLQKNTNGKWYGIEIKGATFAFSVDDDVTKSALTTTSAEFCTGAWVHIVAIRDTTAKQLKLYRNGVIVTSIADATGSVENFQNVYLANCNDINAPYTGALDEVNIFNYALNTTEISNLYTSGLYTLIGSLKSGADFELLCNPNPARSKATFEVFAKKSCKVSLKIIDVSGKTAAVIYQGQIHQGSNKITWDGNDVINEGIYFAILETPFGKLVKKIIVVK
jgi:hypothetical protein